MITLEQYQELFQVAKKYLLTKRDIVIEKDERFSCSYVYCLDDIYNYFRITVSDDDIKEHSDFSHYFINWCKENHGLIDGSEMLSYDFSCMLAFMHELGHINRYFIDSDEGYEEVKNKIGEYAQMKAYREVKKEWNADAFAVKVINENLLEITCILNPNKSIEECKEEVNFWTYVLEK